VTANASIYESGLLREACGPALRPGGVQLTGQAVEFCRFPKGARLLDVGCGSGETVRYLRDVHGFDVSGVDISPGLIGEGVQHDPTLTLLEASAEALPFGEESLDGVFCECVLSLLHDPLKALVEFHRVLRSGGKLILSDLYLRRTPRNSHRYHRTQGIASREDVQGWLRAAGFDGFLLWEDHTRALQELAAKIILTHGSLECLPGLCGGAEGKPGYYLLVTGKNVNQEAGTWIKH
jgi:SAM-dependent methyltransferase